MNYERIYAYRFRDINQDDREVVWQELSSFLHPLLGNPKVVLDPAAGIGEFIRHTPAEEKWAVDAVDFGLGSDPSVKMVIGDTLTADVPENYFDAIWISNFLEHLLSQEQVAEFLERMCTRLKPGGRIAIMGPNYKYCYREYFDCADHTVVLSHIGVAEHVVGAGFDIERVVPRFLPYSFRGHLPAGRGLVRRYLKTPLAWRFLGKQFLVVARRPYTD